MYGKPKSQLAKSKEEWAEHFNEQCHIPQEERQAQFDDLWNRMDADPKAFQPPPPKPVASIQDYIDLAALANLPEVKEAVEKAVKKTKKRRKW